MPNSDIKLDFLFKAIDEVQQTNRFLDAKAGLLSGFVSSLLVVVVSSMLDPAKIELLSGLYSTQKLYWLIFIGLLVFYILCLVLHILLTLRVIFPTENPGAHVELGNFKPRNLFFIHTLGRDGKIVPSLPAYRTAMLKMSPSDVKDELTFEFLKLSYVRKVKNDRLQFSMRFFSALLAGIILLGAMFVTGAYLLN